VFVQAYSNTDIMMHGISRQLKSLKCSGGGISCT